jgi:hypothetical protein
VRGNSGVDARAGHARARSTGDEVSAGRRRAYRFLLDLHQLETLTAKRAVRHFDVVTVLVAEEGGAVRSRRGRASVTVRSHPENFSRKSARTCARRLASGASREP